MIINDPEELRDEIGAVQVKIDALTWQIQGHPEDHEDNAKLQEQIDRSREYLKVLVAQL